MLNRLHGIIFAYRSNAQLRELTQHRNTCSVPYGGRYRMVDFMLSNMVNSGMADVGLIVRNSYQSLLDHVGSGKDWDLSRKRGGLRILPPFSYADKRGNEEYRGRMDALGGVYSYLHQIRQDYVMLAGGDVAVNLDVTKVFEQHIASGADITAVCNSVPRGDPRDCTYFTVDSEGFVSETMVRPRTASGYESMEVYILSKELLIQLVDYCTAHDIPNFSHGVLVGMAKKLRVKAYHHQGYAARLQSVADYYSQSMDLLDPKVRQELFAEERPIATKDRSDPSTYYSSSSNVVNSLVSDGCIIEGEVINSVINHGVRVDKGARVENCVLMQGTHICANAVLKCAITDKKVTVNQGRMLMGHESYPLAIAKNAVV